MTYRFFTMADPRVDEQDAAAKGASGPASAAGKEPAKEDGADKDKDKDAKPAPVKRKASVGWHKKVLG
jgi:hypothetical protein